MFDQLTAVYNRYRVLSTKVEMQFLNTGIEFPNIVAFGADNVTGAYTSIT